MGEEDGFDVVMGPADGEKERRSLLLAVRVSELELLMADNPMDVIDEYLKALRVKAEEFIDTSVGR